MSYPIMCGICGEDITDFVHGTLEGTLVQRDGRNEFYDFDGWLFHRCKGDCLKGRRFVVEPVCG